MPVNNAPLTTGQPPKPEKSLRGRFAPSPTGPLHFGSLVAAVASYLQAKSRQGIWLVRMEDLDPPREAPGAADDILRTLDQHGLHWDEPVLYQSKRHDAYVDALNHLSQAELIYHCSCSRKKISEQQSAEGVSVYPGTCRESGQKPDEWHAIRLKADSRDIGFDDYIQGYFSQNLQVTVGDFVLRRADGLFAYQLAVVVDDENQGITEIVRGSDLLDNTPRQIFLQRLLEYDQPDYAHLPIATNKSGEKLSKQTFAQPINNSSSSRNLIQALEFLGQNPPVELAAYRAEEILKWALNHWQLQKVPKTLKIVMDN